MSERHIEPKVPISFEFLEWFYKAIGEAHALDYHLEQTRRNIEEKGLPTNLRYNPYEAITHLATVCDILASSPHLVGRDSNVNGIIEDLLAKARSSLPDLKTE